MCFYDGLCVSVLYLEPIRKELPRVLVQIGFWGATQYAGRTAIYLAYLIIFLSIGVVP